MIEQIFAIVFDVLMWAGLFVTGGCLLLIGAWFVLNICAGQEQRSDDGR